VIIGVGLDLSAISFWEGALADPTTSVIEGTFTARERAVAESGPVPVSHRLAARFAAKEAFTKALSGGRFGEAPVAKPFAPQEVEVLRDEYGRPRLELHGEAALAAKNLGVRHIWVSLTHEGDNAGAMVVLEG